METFSYSFAVTGRKLISARKVRSPHGTQVARQITCSSCGVTDTIHFSPRPNQQVLCRKCAAEQLGVVDQEANITGKKQEKCGRCGLFLNRICKHDDPLDCTEYSRALAMRQGNRAKTAIRASDGVVRVRRTS